MRKSRVLYDSLMIVDSFERQESVASYEKSRQRGYDAQKQIDERNDSVIDKATT